MQDAKISKNSSSGHQCTAMFLQLRHVLTIGKNLLNSNISPTCSHNMVDIGPLTASLGYPSKFQRISRLGSVTALHSSSGRQPNFAASNRGRHLYSAGRPSRSALAHVLVSYQLVYMICLQCLDTAGWASGRASRL